MKLTCADPACDRAPMRTRDGQRWCIWHPTEAAPPMDMLSGILRGPDGKPKHAEPPARPATRAPRTPRTRPDRARQVPVAAPADGLCDVGDCPRPWRHRGVHTRPKEQPQPPDDGRCTVIGCDRAWKHRGPHVQPRPEGAAASPAGPRAEATPASPARPRPGRPAAPLDAAEAARRYLAGRPLFPLAAEMGVGVARLRAALAAEGVQLRGRGEVVGQRGRPPRPLDADEAVRLYLSGMDSSAVARQLRVHAARVQDVLRERGVLRPRRGVTAAPVNVDEARRLYAAGLTVADVARRLGVQTMRVADALRATGDLRPPRRPAAGAA